MWIWGTNIRGSANARTAGIREFPWSLKSEATLGVPLFLVLNSKVKKKKKPQGVRGLALPSQVSVCCWNMAASITSRQRISISYYSNDEGHRKELWKFS